jgi:hypothetical protein
MGSIEKRENFSFIIKQITEEFNNSGININTYVYILGSDKNCYLYDDVSTCDGLFYEDIYSLSLPDPIQNFYPNLNFSSFQTDIYYKNDWASLIASVSKKNPSSSIFKDDILILFSDSISLGGAVDEFFITDSYELYDPDYSSCDKDFVDCFEPLSDNYYSCLGTIGSFKACNVSVYEGLSTCYSQAYSELVNCYSWTDYTSWCDSTYDATLNSCDNSFFTNINTCYKDLYDTPEYSSCLSISGVDLCYSEGDLCREKIKNSTAKVSAGNLYYKYYCPLNLNYTISDYTVNRSIEFLIDSNKIIFPIIIYNTNVTESENEREAIYDYFDSIGSVLPFGDELNGGDPNTICGKAGCEGCYEDSDVGIFHKETRDHHEKQLNLVVDNTGGLLIKYEVQKNITEIIIDKINFVLNSSIIRLGEISSNQFTQNLHKKQLVYVDGDVFIINYHLDLYPDMNYNFNSSLDFIPVINILSEKPLKVKISHNKDIYSLRFRDNIGNMQEIYTIPDLLYSYNVTFSNVEYDKGVNFIYEDVEGINSNSIIN